MIYFAHPVFLLLLIPLSLYLLIRHQASRSGTLLQFIISLLLILALSGLNVKLPDKEGVLFILCDRSLSMPPDADEKMEKQIEIISRQMKNAPGVISFAGNMLLESPPGQGNFSGLKSVLSYRNASDGGKALQNALSLIPKDTPGRILIISDGNWNGVPPESAFAAAVMRKIKVDFLPLSRGGFNDFAITGVSAPLTAAPGEYCSIVCRIYAPRAAELTCRIRKNNGLWHERKLALKAGENRFFWRDRSDREGVMSYDFLLETPPGDTVPENNRARHLTEIKGTGKILLLTRSPSGNLSKLLARGKFDVETLRVPSERISPETIGSYRAVIFENVPASSITPETNALIAEMVRQGRMGVLMTGGRSSLASGGWYKTPVGEILPGAMEKQHDIRRRNSAFMVALDRSGSMAAAIDGVPKMTMANLAAAESYKLLSERDEFGLIAVDSSVHQVAPLSVKGKSADPSGAIMAIESMGGGIFVDKALHESVRQLLHSKAPVRHLLLFADADDAEQPGNYREMLRRAAKAGITVSVVGLGKPEAADAGLLREIAQLGGGKCYFVENASELPRVFAEDTFVMVRASFSREKVKCRPAADLSALPGAEHIDLPFEADGYNICFAKEKSRILLTADDEDATPIVLTGFAGVGRCALLGIEVDGEYSGKFASHPQSGALIAALTRYVTMPRKNTYKDCFITQNMESGLFESEILLDPERRKLPFQGTPVLSLLVTYANGKVEPHTVPFRWQGTDALKAFYAVPPGATVNAAVEFSSHDILPLAPAIQSVSPEFSRESRSGITALVRQTGGVVRSSFDNIGSTIERQERVFCALPLLLAAAIGLLLLQVWMRRSGREFPTLSFKFPRLKGLDFTFVKPVAHPEKVKKQKETPASSGVKPEEPEQEDISRALKRAKRR